ncbi:PaaX family transcriptional regulator C-terminal domain-containing protein [Streptomyces sp. NPDC055692]|uniref:PaaX family transcriptional regulator n=1 Tax=Streptomyces sp. NPDC055692 TaxID=3155683 RepID=UPI00343B06A8
MTTTTGMPIPEADSIEIPAPTIRHQRLIVTLYGLYSREPGNALPVAALIALLGDLGYDAPGVRSAIHRLKAKNVLRSTRVGGVAAYELSESAQTIFAEGDRRIFSERRDDPKREWLMALFSVPETQRNLRHKLRSLLTSLGFGTVSSGVWIASSSVYDRTQELLAESELSEFVEFFCGDYLFTGDVRAKVAEWWDLDTIDGLMAEFLAEYGDADGTWARLLGDDPAQALRSSTPGMCRAAFRYYIPMLTLWRRLPYRDPNLPLEYLPEGWKEPEARRTFARTHRLIAPLAARHTHRVIAEHRP